MQSLTLLNDQQVQLALRRLARTLVENHDRFEQTVLLGLQPRGIHFCERLAAEIRSIIDAPLHVGKLDITFHRDDFRRHEEPLKASPTEIDFLIEGKKVILVDDVLYTGRTVRAAMDAMLSYGRPENVELCVFIDRRFSRHLPVQADYVGRQVDSLQSEKVSVKWQATDGKDEVVLFTSKGSI